MWQNWTNVILGLGLVVVATLGLTGTTLTWTLIIFGALIAIISFSGTVASSSTSTKHP